MHKSIKAAAEMARRTGSAVTIKSKIKVGKPSKGGRMSSK